MNDMSVPGRVWSDWLDHLEHLHPAGQAGINLGLERVAKVKAVLGQYQNCLVITVGGTNGKGSVCAYLNAIFRAAGYRVGCYTSPHLLDYRERVSIDGRWADEDRLCAAFARVEAARQATGVELTYFEFGTLAAWEIFAEAGLDAIILEVGLGGRLDAVNIYDADCALITGIDLDHTQLLGETREAIAYEKAAIYRPGRPALCADPDPPVSLIDLATGMGADLRLIGRDFGYFGDQSQWVFWAGDRRRGGLAAPGLRGQAQFANAALTLAALDCLRDRLPVPMQAVRKGLLEPGLRGRFQIIPGNPVIILDVAHNPQAIRVMSDNLAQMGFYPRTWAVLGMLSDKDIAASLPALAGRVDGWHLATLDTPRSATGELLAQTIIDTKVGGMVTVHDSVAEALSAARSAADHSDRIIVFGSFYTVAAVLGLLDRDVTCCGRNE